MPSASLAGLGATLIAVGAGAGAARADQTIRPPGVVVPVVSDDEAEWQRERPPAYVGLGTAATMDSHVSAELFVEGAMRVATTPVWVHGAIGTGAETQIQDQGKFIEARGGIELSCVTRRAVCGFFGVDVGGQLESRRGDGESEVLHGVIAVPRMGLDMGGDTVRFRASVDGRWFRYHTPDDDIGKTVGGGGISLAVALRF